MSYILDALKKSERERNLGAIPDLDTIQEQAPIRFNWWPWLVGGLVLLNAGLGIAFLVRQPADQLASQLPGIGEIPRLPAIITPPPAMSVRSEAVSARARLAESRSLDDGNSSVPLRDQSQPESPAALAKQPIEVRPEPILAVAAEAGPLINYPVHVPVTAPNVTKWEDMPADFRARVARPEIDVHAYSSQPERRFVLIELQKYREGERLRSGAEIEEITEKGVIFLDQGMRFEVARP
jgi:general secretion pathway protein B